VSSVEPGILADLKRRVGSRISVCLPARNEETTVGHIVGTIRRELMEAHPLVDEIIVIDDGSTDATAAAARDEGATVFAEAGILPGEPAGSGKGNVLWKSLHVSTGDLVCWVDADIRNFGSHFVTRLIAPLLESDAIVFSKAFYRRPINGAPSGGGRVTELMARPLLSHLFPKLADFVQPLAGEYAGRREVLEAVPFVEGWGVEVGLLIDLAERFGRDSMAQVDLGVRQHRNKPLHRLAPESLAILVAVLERAGLHEPSGDTATLIRFDDDNEIVQAAVEVRERPPIATVEAYRAAHPRLTN
jgi:glucosyl-3-phosphoglycerate synthase